jgi:hypothetical protein
MPQPLLSAVLDDVRARCIPLLLNGPSWSVLEHYLRSIDRLHYDKTGELLAWPTVMAQMADLRIGQAGVVRARHRLRWIRVLRRAYPAAQLGRPLASVMAIDAGFVPPLEAYRRHDDPDLGDPTGEQRDRLWHSAMENHTFDDWSKED